MTQPDQASQQTHVFSYARLRVAVVGGGIGGVALAIGLGRAADLDVRLYEAANAFSEIGAGVSFGPNAVRAIERLELKAPYSDIADGSPAPFEDVWFEWRRWHDDNYLTASLAPGCGQSSVHRADFLDAIVAHLPEGIAHFGKRLASVDQDDHGCRLEFTDGSHAEADIVIGFDGIKSVVREHVLPPQEYGYLGPRYSGTEAYRGMIETGALAQAFEAAGVEPRLARVPQMYLGPDRHVLTFPVKGAELVNVVAFVTDRRATRFTPAGDAPWVVETSQQQMLDDFPGWGPATRTILGLIEAPTRWALHDIAPLPHYRRDRVLLVGDSAHAMLPHQGAGAGQALEDAYVLSELLADPRCDRSSVEDVLAAFETVRRPRASRVQTTSFEAGELYEYAAPGIGDDEARIARELEQRFDWLWQHDPEDDVIASRRQLGWAEAKAER